ncbi:TolC family protein [Spirosoma endbachense]|uniref:Transporter n=1 Tax=Spirosoma endbachense TaxID=2666025 RepID=A0A6P1VWY7_9BACT|nr:TolC family protein [Spirosoma endbachense]QHV97144.1 transporter [Spirosoma endbachense]
MKKISMLVGLLTIPVGLLAQAGQSLTIEDCYTLAKQNYPLIKQRALIQKTSAYSVENAAKGYLPQLTLSGQATYQNQTVDFSESALGAVIPPNVALPKISKDQYKVTGQVDQLIYDGGAIKYTQEARRTDAAIQEQNLEVSLYALRERVNQLFFGIALIDEQLKQTDLRKADIQSGVDKTQGALTNGTAFRSSLNELKAELIRADQATTELKASRRAYVTMLGALINQPLNDSTVFVRPQPITLSAQVNRPELTLYENQKRIYDVQEKQLQAAYRPKVSAFFQENYGRPTFNIINNTFDFFWIGGIRLNWALSSLYTTHRNDVQLLAINRQNVDIQRETFLFNTNLSLAQQSSDVQKYQDLIAQDNQIVDLRASVKNSANAQLQNGVITSHDYINQVNAENEARQNLILHQIQLLQAQYTHKNTSGN